MDKRGAGMNFEVAHNWTPVVSPNHTNGYLVLGSDDGRPGDYNAWMPLFNRIAKDYSSFFPQRAVVGNTCINSNRIGDPDRMSVQQVLELARVYGWEMTNHGKHHASLGKHPLTENASAGQNRIDLLGAGQFKLYSETGLIYKITEGQTSEEIKVTYFEGSGYSAGHILLEQNIQNSYTTDAVVQLTDASLVTEIEGGAEEIQSWGLPYPKHHVASYHSGFHYFYNEDAIDYLKTVMDSSRGYGGVGNNNASDVDFDPIKLGALGLSESLTEAHIDSGLDATAANGGLTILYGHGEGSSHEYRFALLEYIARGALDRGIKIITRTQAFNLLMT